MNTRSAINICINHPECIAALEYLLSQEDGKWLLVKEVREKAGVPLIVWNKFMQKIGWTNGIGLLENSRGNNKSWPSKVRIREGRRYLTEHFIEVVLR